MNPPNAAATGLATPRELQALMDEHVFVGRGLRFAQPQIEAAYVEWQRLRSLPFMRVGCTASLVSWFAALFVSPIVAPAHAAAWAWFVLGVMAPVLIVSIFLTTRPRLIAWTIPVAVVTNAVAGAGLQGLIAQSGGLTYLLSPVLVLSTFVAFTVFRLRPLHAACSVVPFLALHGELLWHELGQGALTMSSLIAQGLLALVAFMSGLLTCSVLDRVSREAYRRERIIEAQQQMIEQERERSDKLLFSILPTEIAERLKSGPLVIADRFGDVTVLFADVVGFTPLAARLGPEQLVSLLNEIFTRFDELAGLHGVEKIKTIGDAYMAVSGVPRPRADHARAAAELALSMRAVIGELSARTGHSIQVRIGLCSGPAVAGVIGARKFAYDLWGDTVNTAARMEAHGVPGEIQLTETTQALLMSSYRTVERGVVEIKGKGPMRTWFLLGSAEQAHEATSTT